MAESSAADPGAIWRDLIAQWEKGFNNLANQTMGSGEFSRYMNQAMTLSMKMQNSMGEVMGRYLKAMNLPNREEIVNLDKRLDAIELELQRLSAGMDRLTNDGSPKTAAIKRPPRTKQPLAGK